MLKNCKLLATEKILIEEVKEMYPIRYPYRSEFWGGSYIDVQEEEL
jgi:hypothetical protein